MSFQEELQAICKQVPGSHSAVVMNLDGLIVARQDESQAAPDIEILLIELTNSLKQALQAAESVEAGAVGEYSLSMDKGELIVRLLRDEHFVALLTEPGALVGRGRYALRVHSRSLIDELG